MQGIGSLFRGVMGLFAGNRQNQIEKNAALQAEQEAGVNAQTALTQGNAVAAQGAVTAAANGGGLTGSSIGVIQNLSDQAMFNARSQVYRGQVEAQKDLYEGAVAKSQGELGLVGAAIDAGSSVLGGMAKSSMLKQQKGYVQTLQGLGQASAYDYQVVGTGVNY